MNPIILSVDKCSLIRPQTKKNFSSLKSFFLFILSLFLLTSGNLFAQVTPAGGGSSTNPGGTNAALLNLWVKGDAGLTFTSGTNVKTWVSQSPASPANTFTASGTGSPQFTTALSYNYNPSVLFNGNNYLLGVNNITMAHVFAVANLVGDNSGGYVTGAVLGNTNTSDASYCFHSEGGLLYASNRAAAVYTSITVPASNSPSLLASLMTENFKKTPAAKDIIRLNAAVTSNTAGGDPAPIVIMPQIGARATYQLISSEPLLSGSAIAELICFKDSLTPTNQSKVESYLATKYGITLDESGSGGKYINSSGTATYSDGGATIPYAYWNNIIGIGRDDSTSLNQKQSHQLDDSTRIYLSSLKTSNTANTGSFSSNNQFVMLGNNNVSTGNTGSSQFPSGYGIVGRMGREWQITNTGFIGTYSIDIKLPPSVCTIDPTQLMLIVGSSNNLTSANVYTASNGLTFSFSGGVLTIGNISTSIIPLNSTKYFTLIMNGASVGGAASSAQTICPGSIPSNLTLSGNTGSVIKWQYSTDNFISSINDIASSASATLTSAQMGALSVNTYYRAVVQNGACSTANSASILITMNSGPTISSVTASPGNICFGSSSNLVVSATGTSSAAATIVNYNFNSGSTYAALAPTLTTGITSTASGTAFGTTTGFVSLGNAFTANTTPGKALTQLPGNTWTFTLGGAALSTYNTFKIYFDAERNPGGNNIITVAYSLNGGAFTSTGVTNTIGANPVALAYNTENEALLTLPAATNNPTSSLAIRLTIGTAGTGNVQLDNFEVQAVQQTTTYSWTGAPSSTAGLPGGAGSALATNNNITVSPTDTTNYTVTVSNGNGCSQTGNVTVNVNPLSVGGTVNSNATVCSSTNNGTVYLTGQIGKVIKWQSSTDGGTIWSDIANTTTSQTYTNLAQTTWGRAVVQSGACASVNSSNVIITVNPVSVGGSVNSSATVCSGINSGTLNLTGNTGSVVKWQSSIDGGTTWADISNTTSSLAYSNLIQTTQYRAVVQSGVCSSANSSAATITANPVSVGGAVTSSATVCSGINSGTLNLTGNTGSVVKWQSSINNGTTWTDIANITSSQTYSNITVATQYRAVVQSGVCSSVNSSAATISVNSTSIGGTVNSNANVCSGTNSGTVYLTGQTGNVVKWQYSSDAGITWTDIVNTATSQTYTNLTQTTWGRAVVQNGVCSSANSSNVIITVNPVPSASISYSGTPFCSTGGSAAVTQTGTLGGIYSSTSGLSLNSSTGVINLSSSTLGNYTVTYRIAAGVCSAYSTTTNVSISLPGSWTGAVSTDWNDSRNWLCGQIPTSVIDVNIEGGLSYYPTITSGIDYAKGVTIQNGGSLTIAGGTLQIFGTITNSGNLDASAGTVEMKGSSAQTIAGSMFNNKLIKNLIVSNTGSGLSVSAVTNDTLKITGTLSFGNSTSTLNTGDNITLVSNSAGTANVGIVGAGNLINGKATVERYINIGTGAGQHAKSWQFLSTPTNGQTIKESWMENGTTPPGYGTQITGAGGTAGGFDVYTATPSLKYYDPVSDGWIGVSNTGIQIYNQNGYMVFVRGDRTVTVYNQPPNTTTMRTKGNLFTGTLPPISVMPDKLQSIGNPYASSIDFTLITKGAAVDDKFYVWDPYLYGSYGLGGYQTLSSINGWAPVPGGTLAYVTGMPYKTIRSGKAFFVHATSTSPSVPQDYTLTFSENCKVNSGAPSNFSRTSSSDMGNRQFFRTSLFTGSNSVGVMADGNVVAFDKSFSNSFDGNDATKILNSGENFGLKMAGKILAIESKSPLVTTDTIFYNMSNLKPQNYQLRFAPENMEATGLQAYLVDSYLKTSIPLSLTDSSFVNITVTSNAASSASDRFKVVFKTMTVLPVTFTSLTATQKNADILVVWKVENESGMQLYEVEKSVDGNTFIKTETVAANNNGTANYSWLDANVIAGYNYYRIRSIGKDGQVNYTKIVKIWIGQTKAAIAVYPNPIADGVINLQLTNQPAGTYGIRLLNSLGQIIVSKEITHAEGSSTESIQYSHKLSKGIYQLEVTKPDGNVEVVKVVK